jgi:hypothetical protein
MKINIKSVQVFIVFILFTSKGFSQSNNADTVRSFQVSFLPFIGFNSMPVNSTVNVSLNILGGYIKEVRVVEIGSLINIEGKNAGKCQLAGVGNLVGGSSTGLQCAGVINIAGAQNGMQASGVLNVVAGDAGKCQLAGVGNVVGGSFKGFQGAGVINISKTLEGLQVAGVLSEVLSDAKSCQLAGVGNIVGGSFEGLQASGVFNYAKNVTGAQISGVINVTPFFKGAQLSVINISDSCQGIPIGVLSFVAKGYHQFEFSADEVFNTNVAFRTGVKRFYNIVMAGIRPGNFDHPLWTFGYGAGTMFGNPDRLSYNIDLTSQHVSKGDFSSFESQLCKLYFGVSKGIGSKTSISIGLTYNLFVTDTHDKNYKDEVSKIAPYTLTNDTYGNGINLKSWIGGKVGIRFW